MNSEGCFYFSEASTMERTYIMDLKDHKGSEVVIKGWVDIRRDQGKMIFLDFRDMSGRIQGVILPNAKEAHEVGSILRPEWVVEVKGKVNARPAKNVQAEKVNGDIELEILAITVLSQAETPPFDISGDGKEIGEEVRLKYKYIARAWLICKFMVLICCVFFCRFLGESVSEFRCFACCIRLTFFIDNFFRIK